jgi:tetratricopeptide (TPR) repeat protein
MDLDSRVVRLCLEGTRAEFQSRIDDARALYLQAWQEAKDDYEACMAAHYVARHQERPEDALRWNQEALSRADAVGDDRVQNFYPSLYLNIGQAHERLGNRSEASRYFALAASLGAVHRGDR